MKAILVALAATAALPAAALAAGPVAQKPGTSADNGAGLLQSVGWRDRRNQYSDRCKPYNGPYGYYGNPYCEGGFTRDGEAGGYEIDLTRFFDGRYYDDRRDRRRWR